MKTQNVYSLVCLLLLVLTARTVQAQIYNTVTTSPAYKNDATTGNAYTVTLGNGGTVTFTVNAVEAKSSPPGSGLSATGTFANTGDDTQDGAFAQDPKNPNPLVLVKTVTWAANCPGWGQLNDCAITITHVDSSGTTCHGVSMYSRGRQRFALASLEYGNTFLSSLVWNVAGFIVGFRNWASLPLASPLTPHPQSQNIFKCKVRLLKSQGDA